MNTLHPQAVLERLRAHLPVAALAERLRTGPSPIDLAESEGPFAAVVVAEAAERTSGPVLVVVPTDQEAETFENDLDLLGVETIGLPWWRTAAYRPASVRAHAFGERAACLARLCLGAKTVVVASQRAFVTPVPPPELFRPLVFDLEEGGSIDPSAVGERLASYGYLRVPRVSLPGEFALRGEVLDLLMPGESEAVRIVFEYDRIERISTFDPAAQSATSRPGRVTLRPMKELVWDARLVDRLGELMPNLPGCAGREGQLLEELAQKG